MKFRNSSQFISSFTSKILPTITLFSVLSLSSPSFAQTKKNMAKSVTLELLVQKKDSLEMITSKTWEQQKKYVGILNDIGAFYQEAKDVTLAMEYLKKVQLISSQIHYDKMYLKSTNNIACVLADDLKDYDQALLLWNDLLKNLNKKDSLTKDEKKSKMLFLVNSVESFFAIGQYEQGKKYLDEVQTMLAMTKSTNVQIQYLYNMGKYMEYIKDYDQAKRYYTQSLALSTSKDNVYYQKWVSDYMVSLDTTLGHQAGQEGDWKEAALHWKSGFYQDKASDTLNAKLLNNDYINAIADIQLNSELVHKEDSLKVSRAETAQVEAENERKYWVIVGMGSAALLLLLGGTGVYVLYDKTKKQNVIIEEKNFALGEKNVELLNKNEKIEAQNKRIEAQKEKLADKNTEMRTNISVGANVQRILLSESKEEDLLKMFPESFLISAPQALVNGDFPYFYQFPTGEKLFLLSDCVGHGVPAAFQGILSNIKIQEFLTKCSSVPFDQFPSALISFLEKSFEEAFMRHGEKLSTRGMDVMCCLFDPHTYKLFYTLVGQSLYIVRDAPTKPYPMEQDKGEAGFGDGREKEFITKSFDVRPGDQLYLYSDGFQSQVGGEMNRPMKSKPFKEHLLTTSVYSAVEQKQALESILKSHRGNNEQTDDITLFRITIPEKPVQES